MVKHHFELSVFRLDGLDVCVNFMGRTWSFPEVTYFSQSSFKRRE